MLRPAASALALAAASMVVWAAGVAAAETPNPPPGFAGLQPTTVSAGGPSGQNATVSTGSAGAKSDGQNSDLGHCGVQTSAAGANETAPPTQIGSSGASTPSCNTGSGSGSGAGTSTQNRTAGAGAGTTGTGQSGTGSGTGSTKKSMVAAASVNDGSQWRTAIWLAFALLLALFLVLLGFVAGRRKPAKTAA